MHPWPNKMHHLPRISNLHWLQWDLSSFTNSKIWHTLGLFKILGERFDIFEKGFLQPVSNSHDQIWPCRGHLTLTLGHRGSQWIDGAFLLRLSVGGHKFFILSLLQLSFCWLKLRLQGSKPICQMFSCMNAYRRTHMTYEMKGNSTISC